jgi:hypothetical protein
MKKQEFEKTVTYGLEPWLIAIITLLAVVAVEVGVLVSKLDNGFHFLWQ